MRKRFLFGCLLLLPAFAFAIPHIPAAASGEITEHAVLLRRPEVFYPPMSRRKGEEGTVKLRIRVLSDGSPGEIVVYSSSGHAGLDKAALDSAQRLRFSPAKTKSGRMMDSWVTLPIMFVLKDDGTPREAASPPAAAPASAGK